MSTILKALKKLEQETQSAGTAAAFQSLSDRPAEPPAPKPNRLWAGVGIGASLIGLGLVLFFILRPAAVPTTQPQGQPVPAAPPKEALAPEDRLPMPKVFPPRQPGEPESAEPAHAPSTHAREYTAEPPEPGDSAARTAPTPAARPANEIAAKPPAVARAPQKASSPKAEAVPMAPTTPPTATPQEKVPPPPPVTAAKPQAPTPAPTPQAAVPAAPREEPTLTPVLPTTTAAAQPAAPEPQPMAMEEQPVTTAPPDPYANVPRLDENSPIKLQAISWAETAEKSIAVINNSVLHEGDSVEGYSVVKIRPDDVIVRREGRMWRANFSIR